MADKKITELSSVSTLPDGAVFTAVDSTRSAGDQNVKISKADLAADIGGGGLEYQAEITTSITLTTQEGLNKVYPVNSLLDIVITVPQGVYSENDVINFQKKGSGSIEFVPSIGVRIRGKRDRENRYFINDSRGIVALLCEGGDVFSIIGNLTIGYTGAVSTVSYGSLREGDTGVNVNVIGSGFSDNMLVSVSSNATLNSFVVNSSTSLTLNLDAVGVQNDTVTITYDNGDVFVDTDAITIAAPSSNIPIGNIISYYKFNNNANDSSVNSFNATNNGVSFTTGKISQSGVFDGALDNFTVPDNANFTFGNGTTDSAFSVTFWVKFNTATGNSVFFEKLTSLGSRYEYLFFHNGTNLRIQLYSQGFDANLLSAEAAFNPTLGQWYHISLTYDGSSTFQGIDIKVDNVTLSLSDVSSGSYVAMQADGSDLFIGARPSQTGIGVDGELDDLVFWDKNLTTIELTEIYDTGNSGNALL